MRYKQMAVRIASINLALLLSEGGVAENFCSFLGKLATATNLPPLSDDAISDIRYVVLQLYGGLLENGI
jgi:hypothetical protein